MLTHLKILGWFYLIFTAAIALMVAIAHYSFFTQYYDAGSGLFTDGIPFSEKYFGFFENYGITPFSLSVTLFNIISGVAFGYGILRYREWARRLGLAIAAIAALSTAARVLQAGAGVPGGGDIMQIVLCAYMFWVLLSREAVARCRPAMP